MTDRYKTLFFDLDETLIDFKQSERHSLNHLLTNYLTHVSSHDEVLASYAQLNQALWARVQNHELRPAEVGVLRFIELTELYNFSLTPAELSDAYQEQLSKQVHWYDACMSLLDRLKPYYKMCIITNGITNVQKRKFEVGAMHRWFEHCVISDEMGINKPDRRIFDHAMEKMGADAEESLMVGDNLDTDGAGANAVGMDFCWINPAEHAYDRDSTEPAHTIKTVSELEEILL